MVRSDGSLPPIDMKLLQVQRFMLEILGFTIPEVPTRLSPVRKEFAVEAISEELTEFKEAETIEDEADALLDISYFALGRLVEMGLLSQACFDEVQRANMDKKRGDLKKDRSKYSAGFDAVKPLGWTPPDFRPYMSLTRADVEAMANHRRDPMQVFPRPTMDPSLRTDVRTMGGNGKHPGIVTAIEKQYTNPPRVLVLGYGRHGKDTVSEMLNRLYGFSFTSSSQFCADEVVYPLFADEDRRIPFIARTRNRLPLEQVDALQDTLEAYHYLDSVDCFKRRHESQALRTLWYEAIRDYNLVDQAALAKGIFASNSIYCGLRSSTEFHAAKNEACFDISIWVDASERLALMDQEDRSSITVEQWMADYTIDNNGTPEQLERNVKALFARFGFQPL